MLVTNNPTLVSIAERNMDGIVPLFYNMRKAAAEEISVSSLFKGLLLAYNGGNIGTPSNNITKIWNSGKMNNENDKAMIKGMMPEGSESVIDETSMFSPGDVFVIGDAVPIPLKIHVALAEERPQSRTIAFWDRWKNAGTVDVTDATTNYITG